ncbi:uncharacterized protein LOC105834979 [Monomorium pharaonis]|uniref:uncharacterized protein LOC105834979 n=1 Tax=Monomorium pharaonis TaxID=307658 RepID=UPI0017470708|nr:uncharacterized protein LOC105834979 [Monomorium pharaonis]
MPRNEHHQNDVLYIMQPTSKILRAIGVWPSIRKERSVYTNAQNLLLICISYTLLSSDLIPGTLYWLMGGTTQVRLQLIPPLFYDIMSMIQYSIFIFRCDQLRQCLKHVEEDWKNIFSVDVRNIMLKSGRTGKRLVTICGIFMYSGAITFRTILPLAQEKIVTDQNVTLRNLACPGYFFSLDVQVSPFYETVFVIQFLSSIVTVSIVTSACGLTAIFVMHACGQLKILINLMRDLVQKQWQKEHEVDKKLAEIIEHQIRVRNFLRLVQHTLQEIYLMEILVNSITICILVYFMTMDWQNRNITSVCTYLISIVNVTIHIFLFCYTGEQLTSQVSLKNINVFDLNTRPLYFTRVLHHVSYDKSITLQVVVLFYKNTLALEMYPNKNYTNDIKYTTQLNRIICHLLGVWPDAEFSFLKNLKSNSLILSCFFLLGCELIPTILYVVFIEKRTRVRLKLISSILFTTVAVLKYFFLVLSKNQVRNCLAQVKDDWQNVVSARSRNSMINKAKIAKRLLVLCGIFMYTSGLYFRTIVPLSKGKSVTDQNITIRHLPCPSYYVLFNGQISPAYEIMFFIQFFSGFIKYTITVAICSLAALFVMHLCGQLEILMALIDNLINETEETNLNRRLALVVEHQIKMRNFLRLVQNTLEHTSLLEVMGCTIVVCLLGHDIITEWEDQNVISMCSYIILLTSIGFNIYIFCFIGEQLSIEGEKLALTVCTLAWYRLPNAKARSLILIIAMSIVPKKLRAGKFFDLSIRTFGDVVKTAVTYLNFIRKMME